MAVSVASFTFACVLLIALAWVRRWRKLRARRLGLPYPPGPEPLPVIGNLKDFDIEHATETYYKWSQKYGELVYINVLGRDMIFINSSKVADDLFEKRMGWGWTFGMMRYGETWRKHRRMFESQFKPSSTRAYWPIMATQTHMLLRRLLDSPDDLDEHLRHNAASTIMKLIYGIDIAPKNDRYVAIAEEALMALGQAAAPGAFLVDLLPILKYVPAWMPGAGFKRKAAQWKKTLYEMRDAPFEATRGPAQPCFVTSALNNIDQKGDIDEQMTLVKQCAGMAYAAAAESMVASLTSFILAMTLFPEIQEKAQRELDAVIGSRLPEFTDRPQLPYIDAILREVMRWYPVTPSGMPHMTTEDDVYNGYFIPAGTAVFGNTWAILHDPEVYPEPMKFKPERYLTEDGKGFNSTPEPLSAFGYGRRICAGRHMADAMLWMSVASILACFRMTPCLDEHGKPIPVKPEFTTGAICAPLPFKCSIKPRSEAFRRVIAETAFL
ncbi:cytochrome P450 [Gloeophyllum trabeum ATCC 11539]|uniref:Cytochrome P450 n=1 Tax=Gloeophyllum trabeum (strain ATCC 11539 / FP-39264 / Madison 617) TaxID=670483 RepID=S7RGF1_GLOTA|nr:cytochrome P450 [Gloeophyllum trabeum ATCC 11539]EPQ51619.1 cytochrome P450 [Gloeophyllum trabeum ATCC 11539]